MGLYIKVVGDSSNSFEFGSYSAFARFRIQLAEYTHGKKFGVEYANWLRQPPATFTQDLPKELLARMGIENKELSDEFKALDIWPFYLLSDCDEEITQAECGKLFKIMNKYKKVLTRKNVDSEFNNLYRQLMAAFQAGKGKSQSEFGVVFQ